jgi:hypothetical protein
VSNSDLLWLSATVVITLAVLYLLKGLLLLFKNVVVVLYNDSVASPLKLEAGVYSAAYVNRLSGIDGLNTYDVGLVSWKTIGAKPRCFRLFIDGVFYYNGPPLLVVRLFNIYDRQAFLWLPHGVRLEMSNVEIDPVAVMRHSHMQPEQQVAN